MIFIGLALGSLTHLPLQPVLNLFQERSVQPDFAVRLFPEADSGLAETQEQFPANIPFIFLTFAALFTPNPLEAR